MFGHLGGVGCRTARAEFVAVQQDGVCHIPQGVSFNQAAIGLDLLSAIDYSIKEIDTISDDLAAQIQIDGNSSVISTFNFDDAVGRVANLINNLNRCGVANNIVIFTQRHQYRSLALIIVVTCKLLLINEMGY